MIAGLVGNVLEWYDFSIYGYFAPAIGRHFFPSKNPTTSLLAAFGVFSAGFIARPLGALVFGYIGDRYSRERALTLSILTMAVPTCATGLMPDYHAIGIAASILLIVLRLIQGLSAGGEYTTSIVFLVERSSHGRRGLMGSLGLFGSIAGGMIGSATAALLTYLMPSEQVMAWGWRIPFICGIGPAFFGIMIRRELRHMPATAYHSAFTLANLLAMQWRSVVRVFGFELLEGVGFYMTFIYLSTYLSSVVRIPEHEALAINTLCMAFVLIVIPVGGMLSDRVGRKPVLLTAAIAAAAFAWPLFRLLNHPGFGSILAGEMAMATIIGLYEGAAPAAAAEAFPAAVRATGVAMAFNLCMTLFGGTTPIVATYLIALTHNEMAPPVYLAAAAVISGLVVLNLRETAEAPLAQ
ncbi:MAG: MFS transporter [Candidatus Binataceae bacterium]